MSRDSQETRIAVIGMGPRGLGALEALATRADGRAFHIDIFDPFSATGAGPNFDPGESSLCLLNVPIRDLSIPQPEALGGQSFTDWLTTDIDADDFPTRPDLGRFLQMRYQTLRDSDLLRIEHRADRVEKLETDGSRWRLKAGDTQHGPYDEVLLVLGQPPVAPDEQIAEWRDHAGRGRGILDEAYPAARLEARADAWSGLTVAVRGLGLSTFDVLRSLTMAQGGAFQQDHYIASGREPARILPFSLDGHPPFPKPRTQAIDARFEPTEAETAGFVELIGKAVVGAEDEVQALVTDALTPVAERILKETGGAGDVAAWLKTEWDTPGEQETGTAMDVLRHGIAMAEATQPPTAGYVIGQIWRKWQNELRSGFNPAPVPPGTAHRLMTFDEGLKRYSYGPPVSSARELLALVEAGLVDLSLAADPDIETTHTGWTLRTEGASAKADVMIDAVLPPPDLSQLTDPLMAGLVARGTVVARGEGMAAEIAPDGTVIDSGGKPIEGLCLLGRLALGSVIAADSLHDCFGMAADRWADGVLSRVD